VKTRTARTTSVILGVLALLIGLVWMGQGLGLIAGSVMSGAMQWFWIGLVLAVAGIALLVAALRRPRALRTR
jgi:hypothetical protein